MRNYLKWDILSRSKDKNELNELVFLFLIKDNEIVYIKQTCELLKGQTLLDKYNLFDRYFTFKVPDGGIDLDLNCYYLKKFKPIYNDIEKELEGLKQVKKEISAKDY